MILKRHFEDFKNFAMKGNVLELAVGVIIGGAFGKIVSSMVNDIIMPLIGLVVGQVDLTSLDWKLGAAGAKELVLRYGSFLQSVVDFLIIAVCIYVFIKLLSKFKKKQQVVEAVVVPTKTEELLTEIRDLLKDRKER